MTREMYWNGGDRGRDRQRTWSHHAAANVSRYLHALLTLLGIQHQVEAAGADPGELAEHDVLRDALHWVKLSVGCGLHQDVNLVTHGETILEKMILDPITEVMFLEIRWLCMCFTGLLVHRFLPHSNDLYCACPW